MTTATPRAARKKMLLLEGALHRLEMMQAKESLAGAAANSVVGRGLPGMLSFLLRHKAGALLASALPLLMGGSRFSRIVRRGALLLGTGAALLGMFSRYRQGSGAEERPMPEDQSTGEKNPGSGRD